MTCRRTALTRVIGIGLGILFAGTVTNAAPTSGDAIEIASNVIHANGGIYDQVLLRGAVGTVEADPGQMTRISFLDLTDDIVQVEFSGAGSLTVSLEDASGPMAPAKYNQPGVEYMRGHASIAITGADATTNVSIFSVGRINAVNQTLFRAGVTYDGFADIARIEITADPTRPAGTSAFGGIRAGNVRFFSTDGFTGIYAAAVNVEGPVTVGDISAYDDAVPVLSFGEDSKFGFLTVAGGNFFQPNGQAIETAGFQAIKMAAGTNSGGVQLPGQTIRGQVESVGLDATAAVVLYPATAITSATTGAQTVIVTAAGVAGEPAWSLVPGAAGAATGVPVTVTLPMTPAAPSPIVNPGGG